MVSDIICGKENYEGETNELCDLGGKRDRNENDGKVLRGVLNYWIKV